MNDNHPTVAYRGYTIQIFKGGDWRRLKWGYLFLDNEVRFQETVGFDTREEAVAAAKTAVDEDNDRQTS